MPSSPTNTPRSASGDQALADAYSATFDDIKSMVRSMVSSSGAGSQRQISSAVRSIIEAQSPTEYPFICRYCFSENNRDWPKIRRIAAAAHLMQTSTFLIDDVLDDSQLRYGLPAFHIIHGIPLTIAVAQYLESFALQTITTEISLRHFSNPVGALAQFNRILPSVYLGQCLDIKASGNPSVTYRSYLHLVSLTTASFISAIARGSALLSGKPRSEVEALGEYGRCYGVALQITDDILDLTASSALTGKDDARDLYCRRMRLPYILALKLARPRDRHVLREFMLRTPTASPHIRRIARLIIEIGAVKEATDVARRYTLRAIRALSGVRPSAASSTLSLLAQELIRDQGLT